MKRIGLFTLFFLFSFNSAFAMQSPAEHVSAEQVAAEFFPVLKALGEAVAAVFVQVTSLERSLSRLEQQRNAHKQRFEHYLQVDQADWERLGVVFGDIENRFRSLERVVLPAKSAGGRRNSWPR